MKYSVVLPTRDRLELLQLAVQTVRDQDYANWEIVISDNASSQDIEGYVRRLGDPRIRSSRSDHALPVTANWNRALQMSTGDYVVMLGDDDALLPGYFSENLRCIEAFARPDALFVQGLQYVYAGVIPGHARSFVQVANCEFLGRQTDPFVLPASEARAVVRMSAGFRVAFPFNMQYWLLSRELIDRLCRNGEFFHSPYPDYYAANTVLLEAKSVVVQPLPLVAIGVSRRSFGYYYFNRRENEGVGFLNNHGHAEDAALQGVVIPGSNMNTSWLLAMEALRRYWGDGHRIRVAHWRYRFLQFRKAYVEREDFAQFLRFLRTHGRTWEVGLWLCLHAVIRLRSFRESPAARQLIREATLDRVHCAYPKVKIYVKEVDARDIAQLSANFAPGQFMRECHEGLSK